MSVMMSDVIEQVDFSVLEDVLGAIPCRSSLRGHQEPHDADWYSIGPCLDVTSVCERRRRKAFADGGWQCVVLDGQGCNAFHPYDQLRFTPVRGS